MSQSSWLANTNSPTLSAGFPDKMVILDVETTGGKADYHRIIEIGLWVIENGQLQDSWQTCINPEQSLPPKITELTGISQDDLVDAPTFSEIADTLWGYLDNRILVAHYARFDYGFIKNEFKRLGRDYRTKPLCSVKLSRRLFPDYKRHGLDYIIRRFDLSIENRHRALDDAFMVYQFFAQISLLQDTETVAMTCRQLIQQATLPQHLPSEQVDRLPITPGVYYFYDNQDRLLYIGKSVNIKNRVLNHFSQDHSQRKGFKFHSQIAQLDFQVTAGDLSACLLENQAIKQHLPIHNVRLRRIRKMYQICINDSTQEARHKIHIKPISANQLPEEDNQQYGLFRTARQASEHLRLLADQHQLCHHVLGIESSALIAQRPCFQYQLKRCAGACCGQESVTAHKQRLIKALSSTQIEKWPWPSGLLVIEQNQEADINWLHLIDGWGLSSSLDQLGRIKRLRIQNHSAYKVRYSS